MKNKFHRYITFFKVESVNIVIYFRIIFSMRIIFNIQKYSEYYLIPKRSKALVMYIIKTLTSYLIKFTKIYYILEII
jgi:hypothetical protein